MGDEMREREEVGANKYFLRLIINNGNLKFEIFLKNM
jgi:hypothetical protein